VEQQKRGIFMLSRAALKEMGISPEQMERIMELHGSSVEALKAKTNATREKLAEQVKMLKKELSQQAEGSFKEQYEALAKDYDSQKATMEEYLAKETNTAKDAAVKALLLVGCKEHGQLHPAALAKALADYERGLVQLDSDGTILNPDEVLEYFVKHWGEFFGKVEAKGVDVGSSHGASARPAYTKEALAKMSAAEINKNWELVREAL